MTVVEDLMLSIKSKHFFFQNVIWEVGNNRREPNQVKIKYGLVKKSDFWSNNQVIWNGPNENCQKKNSTKIDFIKYDIETNTDCKFKGDKVVLLYESEVGTYPHLKIDKNNPSHITFIHGGLPQKVNMIEHLKKLEEIINKKIPNVNFSGFGVIDIEEWRPTYDSNWSSKRIYQNESIKLVLEENNSSEINLSKISNTKLNEAKTIAIKEFNDAAANFFNQTLLKCKELRPQAKWGFYGFPTCNENAGNRNWSFCFPYITDQIIPILNLTDVLYPAPYIVPGQNYSIKNEFVAAVISETKRINKKIKEINGTEKEIYLYTKFEVDQNNDDFSNIEFYDPYYLYIVYNRSQEEKLDGLIVWTTSKNMNNRCFNIKNYIDKVLGPHIKSLNDTEEKTMSTTTIISTTTTIKTISTVDTTSCQASNLDCSGLLTYDNLQKWCNTTFYGPNCLEKKLKSSGIQPPSTTTSPATIF
uniref:Hyaluronidase n=1 Tax=Strongyloides stercoralis TaxID=6248 RepID=A0AAF5I420_STRER